MISESEIIIFLKTEKRTLSCENDKFFIDFGHIIKDYPKKGGYAQDNLHKHVYYELHMVSGGVCEFELEDGERVKVKKGQFVLFPPKYRHRITMESDDFEKTSFSYSLIPKETEEKNFFSFVNDLCNEVKAHKYSKSMKIADERMVTLFKEKRYEYKTAVLYTAVNLIIDMLNIIAGPLEISEKEQHNDERVNRAIEYINNNINMNISVSDVADYIHISTKQLTRIFKEAKEMTPGSYIKTHALKK